MQCSKTALLDEQSGAIRCGAICGGANRRGVGGAKGGDQGECGPATHAPDSAPHKRVKDAGSHTAAYSCPGYPRWEPYAGKLHVRICVGGRGNSHPYRDRGLSFLRCTLHFRFGSKPLQLAVHNSRLANRPGHTHNEAFTFDFATRCSDYNIWNSHFLWYRTGSAVNSQLSCRSWAPRQPWREQEIPVSRFPAKYIWSGLNSDEAARAC